MLEDRDKIILCDVDGVVVREMLAEWLRRYNNDWNDTLTPDMITQWSLIPFVKKECGSKIYTYLNDADFYDNLFIDGESLWGVRKLQELPSTRVVFLSAGVGGAFGKYNILKRHGLISSEKEFVCASDKNLVFGDAMIDDYEENLFAFQHRNPKGTGLLFDAIYNRHVDMPRVRSWLDVVNFFTFTGGA